MFGEIFNKVMRDLMFNKVMRVLNIYVNFISSNNKKQQQLHNT